MADKHEPFQSKGRAHPSGRPKRQERWGVKSCWRIPNEGYVTPRLSRRGLVHAVGFRADIGGSWDELD